MVLALLSTKAVGELIGFAALQRAAGLGQALRSDKALTRHPSRVTRRWKHKPKFRANVQDWGDDLEIDLESYGPDAWLFDMLSAGTRPHEIRPRRKKALRFRPKRRGRYVFAKKVRHPGTKPRRYYEAWAADVKPIIRRHARHVAKG